MTAILRRELRACFTGMTGYLTSAVLLFFAGIFTMAICLRQNSASFEYVISNLTFVFMVLVPILTMRSLAEERRQKTDLLLYSLPISMTDVVVGKFLAIMAALAVPTLALCLYPVILSSYGTLNLGVCYGSIFAFFLLGGALISVGVFISTVTENQLVAAVLTFLALLLDYYLSALSSYVSVGWIASLMQTLCVFDRFDIFVNGVFDLGGVVYFLSVMGIFLFLSVQSLEKRRWS